MGHVVATDYAVGYDVKSALGKIKEVWSENRDFLSSYEQANIAYHIVLGKEITFTPSTFPKKVTQAAIDKAIDLMWDKSSPQTNTADYCKVGQDGWAILNLKVHKTGKHGKEFSIKWPNERHSYGAGTSREKAIAEAKDLLMRYPERESVSLLNEKRVAVAQIYFSETYVNKTGKKNTKTQLVLPAYGYVFKADGHVG